MLLQSNRRRKILNIDLNKFLQVLDAEGIDARVDGSVITVEDELYDQALIAYNALRRSMFIARSAHA